LLKAKVMGEPCEKHKKEQEWAGIFLPNGREQAKKAVREKALLGRSVSDVPQTSWEA
jgi:hypothetical protein